MQNFIRFYAIESKIELSQEFWGKQNSNTPTELYVTQIVSALFIMTYILYVNFLCNFIH